jgi:acyl carrier protein
MKIEKFIELIVDELEIENIIVAPDTILDSLAEWDSMGAMIIIGLVAEHFDITLKGKDIAQLTTIQSLIEKIGTDRFS